MYSITIRIPPQPTKADIEIARARLVYLETRECRQTMSKIMLDTERRLATEKFKELLTK